MSTIVAPKVAKSASTKAATKMSTQYQQCQNKMPATAEPKTKILASNKTTTKMPTQQQQDQNEMPTIPALKIFQIRLNYGVTTDKKSSSILIY